MDLIAAVAVGCVLSNLIYVNYMAVQQLENREIITASNLHPGTGLTNGKTNQPTNQPTPVIVPRRQRF